MLKSDLETGFSDVIGSWKIMAIRFRGSAGARLRHLEQIAALEDRLAPAIRPGGCGISRMIDSILTLFPEPDSPTIPSVSPAAMSYVTPSTAWTTPSSVLNSTVRSLIERTGSGTIR